MDIKDVTLMPQVPRRNKYWLELGGKGETQFIKSEMTFGEPFSSDFLAGLNVNTKHALELKSLVSEKAKSDLIYDCMRHFATHRDFCSWKENLTGLHVGVVELMYSNSCIMGFNIHSIRWIYDKSIQECNRQKSKIIIQHFYDICWSCAFLFNTIDLFTNCQFTARNVWTIISRFDSPEKFFNLCLTRFTQGSPPNFAAEEDKRKKFIEKNKIFDLRQVALLSSPVAASLPLLLPVTRTTANDDGSLVVGEIEKSLVKKNIKRARSTNSPLKPASERRSKQTELSAVISEKQYKRLETGHNKSVQAAKSKKQRHVGLIKQPDISSGHYLDNEFNLSDDFDWLDDDAMSLETSCGSQLEVCLVTVAPHPTDIVSSQMHSAFIDIDSITVDMVITELGVLNNQSSESGFPLITAHSTALDDSAADLQLFDSILAMPSSESSQVFQDPVDDLGFGALMTQLEAEAGDCRITFPSVLPSSSIADLNGEIAFDEWLLVLEAESIEVIDNICCELSGSVENAPNVIVEHVLLSDAMKPWESPVQNPPKKMAAAWALGLRKLAQQPPLTSLTSFSSTAVEDSSLQKVNEYDRETAALVSSLKVQEWTEKMEVISAERWLDAMFVLDAHGKYANTVAVDHCAQLMLRFHELDECLTISDKIFCLGSDLRCHMKGSVGGGIVDPLHCTFQVHVSRAGISMVRVGCFVDNHPPLVICRANGSNDLLVSGEHAWLAVGDTLQILSYLSATIEKFM